MKTSIKLPYALDRFLNLYSFLTVFAGIILVFLFNSPIVHRNQASALGARHGDCSGACHSGDECDPRGDPPVGKMWSCIGDDLGETDYGCYFADTNSDYPGREEGECYLDCDIGWNECGCRISICEQDCRNIHKNDPPGTYTLTENCDNCGQEFTCSCTITQQDVCPYSSTEVKVRELNSLSWASSLSLQEDGSFFIGSFHNNSTNFATDTRLEVTGPNTFHFACDTNVQGTICNNYLVSGVAAGTYTLIVKTFNKSSGFYTENACNGTASVVVSSVPNRQDFTITKEVIGKTNYVAGETVLFNVAISNAGNTVIGQMFIKDIYDNTFLEFVDVSGQRRQDDAVISSANLLAFINPQVPSGEFSIQDLTLYLGDLGIGQKYVLTLTFKTRSVPANITTCNEAIADDSIGQKFDEACINITRNPPPPTDK